MSKNKIIVLIYTRISPSKRHFEGMTNGPRDKVQLVQPRIQLKEIMTNSSTCFRKSSQPKYRNIKLAIISRFTVNFVHFYSIYNIYVFTRTSWQKLWLLTLRSKFDLHYTKCQFHTFFNFKQTICVYIIKANFYAN